jgi:hypothetical protein
MPPDLEEKKMVRVWQVRHTFTSSNGETYRNEKGGEVGIETKPGSPIWVKPDDLDELIESLLEVKNHPVEPYKAPGFRERTSSDEQIVRVDGGYAYTWPGEPLAIGDRVLLPENWLSAVKHGHGPFQGTVTGFGTDYDGVMSAVIKKID